MPTLSIDIETYSSVDLTKSGVYKYVEAPDFEILLFAFSENGGPVEVVDLANGEKIPEDILSQLDNIFVTKTAFNANFERTCIAKHFNIKLRPSQWVCTMVKASMLGLPLSLDQVSKVLKLQEEKDSAGKALIRYFSMPCKPTKSNGGRIRNLPQHNPEKWNQYKEYCKQDVVVEMAVADRISFFQIPKMEKELWSLDQKINDRGIMIDPLFVKNAIGIDRDNRVRLTAESHELTNLENPNSPAQLKLWIGEEMGWPVESLTKEAVPQLIAATDSENVKRVLTIRQEMAKTSVKKYSAMLKGICQDNRVRGLLQFYGANRTGRWAGRLIQVQNLPRNEIKELDLARQMVINDEGEIMDVFFDVPNTLSQLIRTAFVAPPGYKFLITDFSAIEARVIAWLAGERWRLAVFATHGKIYEASAAQMFKVPLASIDKGSPLRQKGKVSELALGYQGGPNALIKMGALKMGLQEEELPKLVKMWRNANQKIVALWKAVGNAAIEAVETGKPQFLQFGLKFFVEKGVFFIELPSKRRLSYMRPRLKDGEFGPALTYEGMDQTTKQWKRMDTYGGKLVENIVQAIARDCLADAMLRVDAAGYSIVMHVHDEIVMEVENGKGSIEEINKIMSTPIPWARGLQLKAESHISKYYKKD